MSTLSHSFCFLPMLRLVASGIFVLGTTLAVSAHEFWIEPVDFTVESGAPIEARNFVGQMLKGSEQPYIVPSFALFEISDADETRPVEGRLGDRPALQVDPVAEGLHIVSYVSKPLTLRYTKPEKFAVFLSKEGLDWVPAAHVARGLPEAGFREAYTRFAKALVAVGGGQGKDRPLGLRLELVALTNPYDTDGPVEAELRFENKPLGGIQIAAFRRDDDGAVTRTVYRTDNDGRVSVPRDSAAATLLSAVHMVEPEASPEERRNVVWHSLWASLTYGAAD